MLIKGKQIATGDDGILTANIKLLNVTTGLLAANAVTAAKAKLDEVWAFTARPSCNLDPSGDNDLARKSYVDNIAAGLKWKDTVRAATAAIGTMATSFADGQTIDTSVTLATGDRILIKDQGDADNGLYIVQASGAPVRASDLPAASDAASMAVFVEEGTANGDKGFVCTNDEGSAVVGTDTLAYTQFTGGVTITYGTPGAIQPDDSAAEGVASTVARSDHTHSNVCAAPGATQLGAAAGEGSASSFSRSDHIHKANTAAAGLADTAAIGTSQDIARADHVHSRDDVVQEGIATEVITGTDTALTATLSGVPINAGELQLWLNGILQVQGAGKDYTVSSQTITWLASTGTAVDMDTTDVLIARYKTQG